MITEQTKEEALNLFRVLERDYKFGDPEHDREKIYSIAKSKMNIEIEKVNTLIDYLVDQKKIRVCYPTVGKDVFRTDDWYLERY